MCKEVENSYRGLGQIILAHNNTILTPPTTTHALLMVSGPVGCRSISIESNARGVAWLVVRGQEKRLRRKQANGVINCDVINPSLALCM